MRNSLVSGNAPLHVRPVLAFLVAMRVNRIKRRRHVVARMNIAGDPGVDNSMFVTGSPWLPAAAILVQVRLSHRRRILAGQSLPGDRAEGPTDLRRVWQVCGGVPVRCDRPRLQHAPVRLHVLSNVWRRMPHPGHPVRRTLGEGRTEKAARWARRGASRRPSIRVAAPRFFGPRRRHLGRSRRGPWLCAYRQAARTRSGPSGQRSHCQAARQCSGNRLLAALHPLRRMLSGLSQQRVTAAWPEPRLGQSLDTSSRGGLVGLRAQLQQLRTSLPDRCHSRAALGRKAGSSPGAGRGESADMPASRRPGGLPIVRR